MEAITINICESIPDGEIWVSDGTEGKIIKAKDLMEGIKRKVENG